MRNYTRNIIGVIMLLLCHFQSTILLSLCVLHPIHGFTLPYCACTRSLYGLNVIFNIFSNVPKLGNKKQFIVAKHRYSARWKNEYNRKGDRCERISS